VSVPKRDLNRVLADQAGLVELSLVRIQLLNQVEPAGAAGLTATFRAGTSPAQLFAAEPGFVGVLPDHLEDVLFADQVDLGRKRVRIPQKLLNGC